MPIYTGTSGVDRLTGSATADTINGLGGEDFIQGLGGNDTLNGGDELDYPYFGDGIDGGDGNDTITGGRGFNTLIGGLGADTITGGDDDDIIVHNGVRLIATEVRRSGPGGTFTTGFNYSFNPYAEDNAIDRLYGGFGSDTIYVGLGDIADGGAGIDQLVVSLQGRTSGINITLGSNWLSQLQTLTGGTLTNFESYWIRATDFDDVIVGDTKVVGGDGADTITTFNGLSSNWNTVFTSGWAVNEMVDGVWGSRLDDGDRDIVSTGGGDDTIHMGLGDQVDGGADNDSLWVTLFGLTSGVNLDLRANDLSVLAAAMGGTITNVEYLFGLHLTQFDDIVMAANPSQPPFSSIQMYGFEGNDQLTGTRLGDYISGGQGNDQLWGGDNQLGGPDDTLDGDEGDDRLDGGTGNDRLNGGTGSDTAIFDGPRSAYSITATGRVVSVIGPDGTDVLIDVEFLQFSDGVIASGVASETSSTLLSGSPYQDTITGGAGAETIFGEAHNDTLNGGGGDDAIDGGENDDTLNGDADNDLLFGNVGNDTLNGGSGNDTLDGGDGLDIAVFSGNRAQYTITYSGDVATIVGPDGTDTAVRVERARFADMTILLGPTAGLAVTGTAAGETLQGSELDDLISGEGGDDIIYSRGGVDTVTAGSGSDTVIVTQGIIGRTGGYYDGGGNPYDGTGHIDTFDASAVTSALTFQIADQFLGVTVAGHTLASFERLISGSGSDVIDLRGFPSRDRYFADVYGGGGNDILYSDGYDNLYGGDGNDVIRGHLGRSDGGAGDDLIYIQAGYAGSGGGERQVSGGDGYDTLNVYGYALTIDLASGQVSGGHAGMQRFNISGIEAVVVDAFDTILNVVRGDGAANWITVADTANNVAASRYEFDGRGGNDVLIGSRGVDVLNGGDDNDVLLGGAGNDAISGGNGYDIAGYNGVRRGYSSASATSVSGGVEGGTDTLTGIEDLAFTDGRLTFARDGQAAQVMRLYDAAFNRAPDQSGFEALLDTLENGSLTLQQLANEFITSTEFQSQYAGLTNQQFVEQLYQFCLNRAGDSGGVTTWVNALNGGMTRGEVLLAFSESGEHKDILQGQLDQGLWVADEQTLMIARLYDATYDRLPDQAGLKTWRDALGGGMSLIAIAQAFATAPEFQARYGSLSNQQFVELMYQLCLNRNGDAGGIQTWVDALNGGMSRGEVLYNFSESSEHVALTRPTWLGGVRCTDVAQGSPALADDKHDDGAQVLPGPADQGTDDGHDSKDAGPQVLPGAEQTNEGKAADDGGPQILPGPADNGLAPAGKDADGREVLPGLMDDGFLPGLKGDDDGREVLPGVIDSVTDDGVDLLGLDRVEMGRAWTGLEHRLAMLFLATDEQAPGMDTDVDASSLDHHHNPDPWGA